MTLSAFILVVIAAVLHSMWNLAAKKASGNIGVFWLGLCFGSLLLAPFALLVALEGFDPAGLPYILATGLIHTAYFALLAASYRHGEMSLVYPLARGSGVAGTAVVASAFLGEPASWIGAVGLLFVSTGILLLAVREFRGRSAIHACCLALLVGLTIIAYSIVDKLGVGLVHPVVYIAGLMGGAAVFLAPYALIRGKDECRNAWSERKTQSAGVGLGVAITYLLVLFAFQMDSVSYVVAVRELSIVVVIMLSAAVLKEPLTVPRVLSAGAILVGVVLLKIA